MNNADILSYSFTLFIIAIAPGPCILVLLVRAASNDLKGAVGFGIGYSVGGVAIITAVCYGLATWLSTSPEVFNYSKYVMLAYILFLAHGIWKGGFDLNKNGDCKKSTFTSAMTAGLFTCFISPYMMILFPLVLPEMADITTIKMPDFLLIALSTFLSIFAAAAVVVIFAAQVRRLIRSDIAAKRMNKTLASLLVIGGSVMAFG
ncbi:MAG: LysE family transporter [Pseudomonadota bacterium]